MPALSTTISVTRYTSLNDFLLQTFHRISVSYDRRIPTLMISHDPEVLCLLLTCTKSTHSSCVASTEFLIAFCSTIFRKLQYISLFAAKGSAFTPINCCLTAVVVQISLLLYTDDNYCIVDLPSASFFIKSWLQLSSQVKIEPKYTNESTSPLTVIFVFIPLFPHAINFALSVLISRPSVSLKALTRFISSCRSSGEVAMSTTSSAYRRLLITLPPIWNPLL